MNTASLKLPSVCSSSLRSRTLLKSYEYSQPSFYALVEFMQRGHNHKGVNQKRHSHHKQGVNIIEGSQPEGV
jgi:hypothetical protein